MAGSWVTDDSGTRWVEYAERKRRKPARALRFAGLIIGDQLMEKARGDWGRKFPTFWLVTDLWFDPVAGQRDGTAGRMVAVIRIDQHGELVGEKYRHTLRGLASQGFHYAKHDRIAECKARLAAMKDGSVVGIGLGRARPKLPGRRL